MKKRHFGGPVPLVRCVKIRIILMIGEEEVGGIRNFKEFTYSVDVEVESVHKPQAKVNGQH